MFPLQASEGLTKDSRVTRCVTPYDFCGVDIEVAPGFLEFLFMRERAESSTSNSYFLRIQ